jgi:hypothetical protein
VRKRDEEDGSSAGVAGGVGGAGVERQMANVDLMIGGRLRCSYKRITFVLCAGNLVVALYMLQLVVGPLYFQTSTTTTTTNSSLHGSNFSSPFLSFIWFWSFSCYKFLWFCCDPNFQVCALHVLFHAWLPCFYPPPHPPPPPPSWPPGLWWVCWLCSLWI